MVKSIDFLFSI